jgi:hypothetical protein
MNEVDTQKMAFTLTVGELVSVIKDELLDDIRPQPIQAAEPIKYLYSLRELADFLGCSIVTAWKLKNSGRIPYQQFNRKLIFNSSEVLKALRANKKTLHYAR